MDTYRRYAEKVKANKEALVRFLVKAKMEKKVCALGASTKGNVLMQYCGISTDDIPVIGEVNEDKFGKYSPGTLIPIVPESDLLTEEWDYHIILPWHFKDFFLSASHLKGRTLVFPLPELHVIHV